MRRGVATALVRHLARRSRRSRAIAVTANPHADGVLPLGRLRRRRRRRDAVRARAADAAQRRRSISAVTHPSPMPSEIRWYSPPGTGLPAKPTPARTKQAEHAHAARRGGAAASRPDPAGPRRTPPPGCRGTPARRRGRAACPRGVLSAGGAGRVAEDRVGAERARAQQADGGRADQPTPPTEARRAREQERARDREVGPLLPTPLAPRQRADRVAQRVVVRRASRPRRGRPPRTAGPPTRPPGAARVRFTPAREPRGMRGHVTAPDAIAMSTSGLRAAPTPRWALRAPDPFVRCDRRGSSVMITQSCESQLVVMPFLVTCGAARRLVVVDEDVVVAAAAGPDGLLRGFPRSGVSAAATPTPDRAPQPRCGRR